MQNSKIIQWLHNLIAKTDSLPLWPLGFLLMAIVFLPYRILGEGSVFPIHDQLDETIMTYILNARYLGTGTGIFPEPLGGINVSGMQPSAVLFIFLYRLFPAFTAFILQYAIVFAAGFFGMYLCTREITESNLLALVTAGCYCMLPVQPVYGLSVMGVPLLLYSFLCLYRKKHIMPSLLLIFFFGLTTHLVLIGYVVLGFWALALLWMMIRKKTVKWCGLGFLELLAIYIMVNYRLFAELLLGRSSYASHREELVNAAMPFWETVWAVFCNSAQHAESLHKYLIIPIAVMLLTGGALYRRLDETARVRYRAALAGMLVLVGTAVLYGICKSQPVADFKNNSAGFLRYFQLERFYWVYPAVWYLEFALCFSLWWQWKGRAVLQSPLIKLTVLGIVLLPTLQLIKENSYFYMSVNQMNNGSDITGYISWESYYAEELMQELEETIGRDRDSYRVAHLGISPAPALMHGFYTVDGYSNNYPLEYKHRFRRVIAGELSKAPDTRVYFDTWGSRCYLFNASTGNAWMLGKKQKIIYEGLEFNMEALRELGCEYLFSCGEIMNAQELGMELLGYFETETSYWGIWLYQL